MSSCYGVPFTRDILSHLITVTLSRRQSGPPIFLRARSECACAMRCAPHSSLIQTHTCTLALLCGKFVTFQCSSQTAAATDIREQKATYDSCQDELSVAHELLCCKPKHCEIQVLSFFFFNCQHSIVFHRKTYSVVVFLLFLHLHLLLFLSLHGNYLHY